MSLVKAHVASLRKTLRVSVAATLGMVPSWPKAQLTSNTACGRRRA
jgi:hypothetical protein